MMFQYCCTGGGGGSIGRYGSSGPDPCTDRTPMAQELRLVLNKCDAVNDPASMLHCCCVQPGRGRGKGYR